MIKSIIIINHYTLVVTLLKSFILIIQKLMINCFNYLLDQL